MTRFWWDNNENEKKMAWVAWERIAKPKSVGGLGLRDFQKFNDALLAKIGWRMIQKPDSLLCKTLSLQENTRLTMKINEENWSSVLGKYCPGGSILTATEASVMSHGWRSVLLGRDLLLKNLGWAVGDGKSINVWRDPWLSMSKQARPMGPPGEQAVDLTVADLMVPGGQQ
ncbi:uncharacterized mitochondrial protein AtMg00310-like [Brassica rapa]|uniref:uncharacterized mitochondrial protein AtMg00310-like n=1 Tax=Brassica campestris TaxID=3711 RepID=UPI000871F57B|nr:uncharacterized mitochondrial protein AtMg00310-like [Brassica rapa]XP_048590880.1 uncharacterized mitochondrial protein AtMg00310-like [Brassica napus]